MKKYYFILKNSTSNSPVKYIKVYADNKDKATEIIKASQYAIQYIKSCSEEHFFTEFKKDITCKEVLVDADDGWILTTQKMDKRDKSIISYSMEYISIKEINTLLLSLDKEQQISNDDRERMISTIAKKAHASIERVEPKIYEVHLKDEDRTIYMSDPKLRKMYYSSLFSTQKHQIFPSIPLVILTGAGGTGKTEIAKGLKRMYGDDIHIDISYTTRRPREGEINGIDYNFITLEEFRQKITNGTIFEHTTVNGNMYGSSKSFLDDPHKPIVSIKTPLGAEALTKAVKDSNSEVVAIKILIESPKNIRYERIDSSRGSEYVDQEKKKDLNFIQELKESHYKENLKISSVNPRDSFFQTTEIMNKIDCFLISKEHITPMDKVIAFNDIPTLKLLKDSSLFDVRNFTKEILFVRLEGDDIKKKSLFASASLIGLSADTEDIEIASSILDINDTVVDTLGEDKTEDIAMLQLNIIQEAAKINDIIIIKSTPQDIYEKVLPYIPNNEWIDTNYRKDILSKEIVINTDRLSDKELLDPQKAKEIITQNNFNIKKKNLYSCNRT